jgi:hypothetical protein
VIGTTCFYEAFIFISRANSPSWCRFTATSSKIDTLSEESKDYDEGLEASTITKKSDNDKSHDVGKREEGNIPVLTFCWIFRSYKCIFHVQELNPYLNIWAKKSKLAIVILAKTATSIVTVTLKVAVLQIPIRLDG